MSKKGLLEILMSRPNLNASKSVVVDVKSDFDEIHKTYDSLRRDELPLRKRMFLWKADVYRTDPEFHMPKTRTHQSRAKGTKNPYKIKNLIGSEYSYFIIGAYDIKVPSG